jgi:hypothetical protein
MIQSHWGLNRPLQVGVSEISVGKITYEGVNELLTFRSGTQAILEFFWDVFPVL